MAKFAAGDDASGAVGARFKAYLKDFATARVDFESFRRPFTNQEIDAIYRFRNAIVHSFGLYSEVGGSQIRLFLVPRGYTNSHAVVVQTDNGWHLCIDDLFERFCFSLYRYQVALALLPELQEKFARIFPKYGVLFMTEIQPASPADPPTAG